MALLGNIFLSQLSYRQHNSTSLNLSQRKSSQAIRRRIFSWPDLKELGIFKKLNYRSYFIAINNDRWKDKVWMIVIDDWCEQQTILRNYSHIKIHTCIYIIIWSKYSVDFLNSPGRTLVHCHLLNFLSSSTRIRWSARWLGTSLSGVFRRFQNSSWTGLPWKHLWIENNNERKQKNVWLRFFHQPSTFVIFTRSRGRFARSERFRVDRSCAVRLVCIRLLHLTDQALPFV